MAKRSREKTVQKAAPLPQKLDLFSGWRPFAVLAALTLFFFWTPLTDPNTTPQWDAIDTHYSPQKYFADHLREGVLPFWTPYIFSGFPFLADPQVGAWYPLNWPFFLAGVTPKAIEAELALHTLLAAAGMFLLVLRFTPSRAAALIGALFFAFCGYFADHTQHVARYCGACWLPWLALFLLWALDGKTLLWTAAGGLAAGSMILVGDFQAALYAFYGLALFAAGVVMLRRESLARAAGFLAGATAIAVLLSAVMSLPGLELTAYSERAAADYGDTTDRILRLSALANLFYPNATGAFTDSAQPETAYYLYSGLLLVPLAALGLRDRRARIVGLALIVPVTWFMLGPSFGLYRLGAILPGLHKVRAPVHFWFVPVFGLAILAAVGAAWLLDRPGSRRAMFSAILVCVVFGDLYYFNTYSHPGVYSRMSFAERYGNLEENTRQKVALQMPALTRFHAQDKLAAFGPLNHPLDLHLETTYGYNPLILTHYDEYRDAVKSNPRLLPAMNASRALEPKQGAILPLEVVLPRAYFARSVEVVDPSKSKDRLTTLDPAHTTLVTEDAPVDPDASVLSITPGEQQLRVRYRASRPALLRVAIPYYPGWTATVDGAEARVLPADHAFLGVVVPPGEHEAILRFHSIYFTLGASISAATLATAIALIVWRRREWHRS